MRIISKIIIILISILFIQCNSLEEPAVVNQPDALMLFGASFAEKSNGWFELACEQLKVTPINKAKSGDAIYDDAQRMANNVRYTFKELERSEYLIIMHVHNKDVYDETNLKETCEDYESIILKNKDYAVAYDYVIKKYKKDCEELEFNPESEYYGIKGGKTPKIILCTHWHDSREIYNTAIRKLAEKWNLPLVEFDKKIGFSKEDNPQDPGKPSREFSVNDENIDGILYGWHPKRGKEEEIQQRMANIFINSILEWKVPNRE